MSSETIVNGLFLITAVIAAAVLINAIMPAIYRTSETFGSSTHQADSLMRTDFKFVNGYANTTNDEFKVWLKNTGSARIAEGDLISSDLFIMAGGEMKRVGLLGNYTVEDRVVPNAFWNPGETLSITCNPGNIPVRGQIITSTLVLPNGIKRSFDFTAS
jgi:flagellar protein FlaG